MDKTFNRLSSPDVLPTVDEATSPVAKNNAPLCIVVDDDPITRRHLSLILHGFGIKIIELTDYAELNKVRVPRAPDLIFHNISVDSPNAIKSILLLAKRNYTGAVQLMSSRGAAVLEHVKTVGIAHKLTMLPILKKPFSGDTIVTLIQSLKLGLPSPVVMSIELDEALSNNWIEFWYQPTINLQKRHLVGIEAFVRARHPQHGIVLPEGIMHGSSEKSMQKLSEIAINSALKTGDNLSKLGFNLRIAVNVPVAVLETLRIDELIKNYPGQGDKRPGLTIDVIEDQIINNLELVNHIAKKLERYNVKFAIDNFGRGHSSLSQLKEIPFAEIKIDRSFINNCGTGTNASLCKTIIDLAHNFGSTAVAIGIEKATDALALMSMGCDFGQGYLFGHPMPEEQLISLLRQRTNEKTHK